MALRFSIKIDDVEVKTSGRSVANSLKDAWKYVTNPELYDRLREGETITITLKKDDGE